MSVALAVIRFMYGVCFGHALSVFLSIKAEGFPNARLETPALAKRNFHLPSTSGKQYLRLETLKDVMMSSHVAWPSMSCDHPYKGAPQMETAV